MEQAVASRVETVINKLRRWLLTGLGDYLVGLGDVGGYGLGEVGVELGGVFSG